MTLIKRYELGYMPRDFFLEQLLGCGQQTIAVEGVERFTFYRERKAERHAYDYFIQPYERTSAP